MNIKQCDQCKKTIPSLRGFYLRNEQNASSGSISSTPNTLDLCSWRCVEEYAKGQTK